MTELNRSGFINQYPPLNILNLTDVSCVYHKDEIHLYVHIPFCKAKCDFCYYLSDPISNGPVPGDYVRALTKEIKIYSQMPEIKSKQVRTIYFGGGTPTLLDEKQIVMLVEAIQNGYNVMNNIEFCCEAGPEADLSKEKLLLLKKLGVNRISIGCQCTDDKVLRANGRYRSVANFYRAFDLIKNVEFPSVNVDIMSGLVNQSQEVFFKTIDDILELQPENISIYKLEVYLNNQLYKRYRNDEIKLCSDESEIEQVRIGYKKILERGYALANHYSFHRDKQYEHVHRRDIWNGADMLGLGLSSHSNVNGCLYQNQFSMSAYLTAIEKGALPIKRGYKMNVCDKISRKVILGLKNLSINRKELLDQFGFDPLEKYQEAITELRERGLAAISQNEVSLTIEGALFADDIVKEFYLPQHKQLSLAHAQRPLAYS